MSQKKSFTGFVVAFSIFMVLAALCAAAVGVLTYLGIFFEFSEPLVMLIAGCAVAVLTLILWVWFLGINASLKKIKA